MTQPRTICIILGRFGDVCSVLPCVHHIALQEGGQCAVMASAPFASILEGCSYVVPVVVPIHFTDIDGAVTEAQRLGYERILIGQTKDKAVSVTTQCASFTEEAWRQLGCLHLYDTLPLVFDQRVAARETALRSQFPPPYALFNFGGVSSPLPGGNQWLQRNKRMLEQSIGCECAWIDLSLIQAVRIYDLLGLMDHAKLLVTCDTAALHLAAASKVPTINFIQCAPTMWHGSRPRNNSVLEMRYNEIRDLTEPLKLK